jgi:2-polyprenyl-3-methyl-5-hydroxy-6-metoxy-1,4-benzoquinol methylase
MGVEAALKDEISERVNSFLKARGNVKLLEAGCGSASHFCFISVKDIAGIDISQEQLDRNTLIQEKILGDIQTYPLPNMEYDVVICWDVLEHVSRPREALLNLFRAVKPEGLIILGFPNLISFKGIVTKLTPYWFHRYMYSKVLRYESIPFPTYLRTAMRPMKVIRLAKENGLATEFYKLMEGGVSREITERYGLIKWTFSIINMCLRIISIGRCPSLYLDYCSLILKKCADTEVNACGTITRKSLPGKL